MRMQGLQLWVPDPEVLIPFYRDVLGMRYRCEAGRHLLQYGEPGVWVELIAGQGRYSYARSDAYWKIGITVPDVDAARDWLAQRGVACSEPKQFRDIGYMCHLQDPAGFQIELLQHTFEGQPKTARGDSSLALGGGAQIGQITLRVTDIDAALAAYQAEQNMRLLSIQPVSDFGFDLYFLAHTEETPPHADLEAVENRPWLWQRPYTTLELQHLLDPVELTSPEAPASGAHRVVFG